MDAQVELLRQFVNVCKRNPAILHEPRFEFYKDYLERLFFQLGLYYSSFLSITLSFNTYIYRFSVEREKRYIICCKNKKFSEELKLCHCSFEKRKTLVNLLISTGVLN